MSQKYLRTYDNTKWVVERHHEVETDIGCYSGALTLHRLDDRNKRWTLIDTVWFEHKQKKMIVPIPPPFLCGCGTIHDVTENCKEN